MLAFSVNADLSAILAGGFEFYRAVYRGVERVIAPDTYIIACFDMGAHLADQDGAGGDSFAAETLDSKHLGLTVAAVAG